MQSCYDLGENTTLLSYSRVVVTILIAECPMVCNYRWILIIAHLFYYCVPSIVRDSQFERGQRLPSIVSSFFFPVNKLETCDCQIWSAYKDQKHDLFLPSNAQSSAAGVAGLIESSSSRLTYALTAPPPQPNMVKPPASVPSEINGRLDQLS